MAWLSPRMLANRAQSKTLAPPSDKRAITRAKPPPATSTSQQRGTGCRRIRRSGAVIEGDWTALGIDKANPFDTLPRKQIPI